MKHLNLSFLGLILTFGLAGCTSNTGSGTTKQNAKTTFITIGTGGVTGVYYPTGQAIAQMLNKKEAEYGIKASVESTAGSVFNTNAVLSGDLDFGVVQSDRQYQAVNGQKEWEGKKNPKLRSVFSIHSEAVTLVAAEESGINTLPDIKGKTVNIGNPGSGQRGNAIDVLKTAGLDAEKDFTAESLKPAEAPKMLQDSRIDAFFYTVGHPSGAITEATAGKRKVKIIPITGMEKLLADAPYYAETTISNELYPQATNTEPVTTIGVKATFLTSSDTPDSVVYALTKEVFENFEEFKSLHPAFASLTKEFMLKALSAPVHPGALKYYEEVGLADQIPEKLKSAGTN